MKITVYQHMYVSSDKTMALVILVGENGSVIDRHTSTYEAYPLAQIAWENLEHVSRVLRRCYNADTIDYHCNILGRYHLARKDSGYARELVEHRLIGKADKRAVSWAEPAVEEGTEENAA